MKKILGLILAMAVVLSLSTAALAANSGSDYSDIPTGWSHDAVVAAIENGLLKGYDGKVNPRGFLTRAEMAAVIVRAFGGTKQADISAFKDVGTDKWYYGEMAVAVQMGIFEGDGTRLRPEDNITREQAALVLARAFKLTDTGADLSVFQDEDDISSWARDGVAAIVKAGYMRGDGKNLNPKNNISREEFAQLMYNLVSGYVTQAGTLNVVPAGNLVIRVPGVTLENVTINGDIVVGDGVGSGDFTLKNCTLNGRLVVRGGGADTIYIINTGIGGSVIISRRDGAVHVSVDGGSEVKKIVVDDGSDKVIISGEFGDLAINCDVDVELRRAAVDNVTISAAGAGLLVDKDSTVSDIDVAASGVQVNVAGKVTLVHVKAGAAGTVIAGSGRVENVTAEAGSSDTRVDTAGTIVVNNSSTPVKTNKGSDIAPGTTGKTGEQDAGPAAYYKLTLSISDGVKSITRSTASTTLSGSTPFYAQAVMLLEENRTALRDAFPDAAARDILDAGIAAYQGSDADWESFVDLYGDVIEEHDSDFLNRDATFAQLIGTHVFTYNVNSNTYTVTITISAI